ncbi:C2 domain-containing protein [Heracleum sosnowskyi]|uniref:C2 domain-containing protein n=1 Tax=Heracleum sosnowskyi TaxID=360622 RepID=A0AAD8ISY3_9APIA|nr:C2 domain-containing protein [Heracleum sosnowskyi]
MEYRTLDVNIIAAKGLKNVNLFSKLEVYAVVTISGGDPRAKQRTQTDKINGTNPTWNFPMKFTVDEMAAQQNHLTLVITLRAERALGDKDVGEVRVPMKEIMGDGKGVEFVNYQVRKASGKPKGELNFSYKFSEKIAGASHVTSKSDEPVTAYPAAAPAVGSSSGYPPQAGGYPPAGYPQGGQPQQQGYNNYPPPQQGYGYPPQQPGYGYPPQQVQKPKSKFGGGGMGLGLLGGALGGLLIGDMISDGFDDGGGFDF